MIPAPMICVFYDNIWIWNGPIEVSGKGKCILLVLIWHRIQKLVTRNANKPHISHSFICQSQSQ